MALDVSQRVTLAAHIRANTDPTIVAALGGAGRDDSTITAFYNGDTTDYVWKSNVSPVEYKAALVWTEVDSLTAGQARIWEWVTAGMTASVDAQDANVRQGIADAFGAGTTTRPNLLAAAKRFARVCETVFGYSSGDGTSGTPGIPNYEGTVSTEDVGRALNENP